MRFFVELLVRAKTFLRNGVLAEVFEVARDICFVRLLVPLPRLKAWLYLALAIVLLGGLGTWITLGLVQHNQSDVGALIHSVITYVIAIAATSIIDLMLDDDTSGAVRLSVLALAILACLPISYALYGYLIQRHSPGTGLWDVGVLMLPSWGLWWLTNAQNPRFEHRPRSDAAAGGDAMGKI